MSDVEQVLRWEKSFWSEKTTLYKGDEQVGNIEKVGFWKTMYQVSIFGKAYEAEVTGFFDLKLTLRKPGGRTETIDLSGFGNKAKRASGERFKQNMWQTSWKWWDDNQKLMESSSNGCGTKGDIYMNPDLEQHEFLDLLAAGFAVHNYFVLMTVMAVIVIVVVM